MPKGQRHSARHTFLFLFTRYYYIVVVVVIITITLYYKILYYYNSVALRRTPTLIR